MYKLFLKFERFDSGTTFAQYHFQYFDRAKLYLGRITKKSSSRRVVTKNLVCSNCKTFANLTQTTIWQWLFLFVVFIACVDLHTESFNCWCEYDEMLPDTSFQSGYQSLINVWSSFLTLKKVQVFTKSVVNKIRWNNANGTVIVSTADGRSFEADYVIVTASLGK